MARTVTRISDTDRITRRRRPTSAFIPALLAALVIACSGAAAPSSSPGGGTRCASGGGQATAYPGWPSSDPQIIPSFVSSEIAVGPNRFLFQVLDLQNKPIAGSDIGVDLRFFDLAHDPAKAVVDAKATYFEVTPGRGLYRTSVEFPCAGDWGVEMIAHQTGGADRVARAVIDVRDATQTPPIGSKMPPLDTPTLKAGDDIKTITTDSTPDPDFYMTSVRQALADKRPFLFLLATPAFCKTRTCGPALDLVQAAAGPYKDRVSFMQVEPYQMRFQDGSLQPILGPTCDAQPPGQKVCDLQPIPIVDQLHLITEPYAFAVDRTGTIIGKYEGVMGRDELDAVLTQLAK